MKPDEMLQELEAAAEALSVKVSYEALGASVGHGGLCRVKGQYRVIIDKRASTEERCTTLARALARLIGASPGSSDNAALSPKVREVVDYYAAIRPAS